jgi:hypothetical protein
VADMEAWQSRPLDSVYAVVLIDAIAGPRSGSGPLSPGGAANRRGLAPTRPPTSYQTPCRGGYGSPARRATPEAATTRSPDQPPPATGPAPRVPGARTRISPLAAGSRA